MKPSEDYKFYNHQSQPFEMSDDIESVLGINYERKCAQINAMADLYLAPYRGEEDMTRQIHAEINKQGECIVEVTTRTQHVWEQVVFKYIVVKGRDIPVFYGTDGCKRE